MSRPPNATGHVVDDNGCWIWQGPVHSQGYGHSCHKLAHRLAWEEAHGPIPSGKNVLHRCDVKLCVNPDHLFLGSQKDNLQDMSRKGRWRNAQTKLTRSDVYRLRSLRAIGWLQEDLARAFGISQAQVSRIVNRRHWS